MSGTATYLTASTDEELLASNLLPEEGAFGLLLSSEHITQTVMYFNFIAKTISLVGGLNLMEYRLLARAARHRGGTPVARLQDELGCHQSALTVLMSSLEQRELGNRMFSKGSRKNIDFVPSQKGLDLIAVIDERAWGRLAAHDAARSAIAAPIVRLGQEERHFGERGPWIVAELCDLIYGTHTRMVSAASECTGLSLTKYRMVLLMLQLGGPLSVGDLAEQLNLSLRNASAQVAELVEFRYVTRSCLVSDRRVVMLTLTASGHSCARQGFTCMLQALRVLYDDSGYTGDEILELVRGWRKTAVAGWSVLQM